MSEKCSELLQEWERRYRLGEDISAEELVSELLEELRAAIRLLRRHFKSHPP